MRVLITGGAGMLGRKLTGRLLDLGQLRDASIDAIDLVDLVESPIESEGCTAHVADFSRPGEAEALVALEPDVVFHLAAVVSAEAEADFDKGMAVNVDGTRRLFDAIRLSPITPRVVYASSIAVFGAPFPDPIPDDFHPTPLTSYGTQKLIGEALLADYSRRGFFDGIGIRLPTVSVRPGAPNAAASSFFSGIIREPVDGVEAKLPVSRDVRHPHASPRAAVGFLVHAAELDTKRLQGRRNVTMPGVSVKVGEQIEALERVAGSEAAALIVESPDPAVAEIVAGWPQRFDAARATALGFAADANYDDIVRAYMEDDLR
ncbi:MAG: SDR family oxidoreductase [Acidimicrobiaceae bacterium]|nr:SDR family oxidoreductase [Acidimicrobiaceae bacterium]MXZ99206.1 SDR family oxidoreductase [Acidimicrobiaceae bacterium]MYE97900.1 SDR family oxidoreductase [Acidimicrobiaceae bacterium]MYH43328.1 SDR family oxidoreductase [Acidimicrobiaceae bacterium]MYI54935.1 SDR family oxidoreductase [Acidimicrobiaceae bacterium]